MHTSLIRKADYDFYTMAVPFRMIRRRQRMLFIRRELEKRHPQFSERYCSDVRLSVRKGTLIAEVTVMDVVRLAEYRKQYPRRHLYLEHRPQHAVFVRRNSVRSLILVCSVAVLLLCLGGAAVHGRAAQSVTARSEPQQVAAAVALLPAERLFASLLSAVSKKGGSLTQCAWQDGSCQFAVSGCHPEDIVSDTTCTVSYANAVPRFSLTLPVARGNHLTVGGDTHFVSGLRRELLRSGMVILSENIGQADVTVQLFVPHAALSRALKICAEQAELYQWHERALVVQSGENGCDIKASFSAGAQFYEEQSPFQVVAAYASLFMPRLVLPRVRQRPSPSVIETVLRDKVGEIKRLDGTVFAYYRLQDGRIVCEKAQ